MLCVLNTFKYIKYRLRTRKSRARSASFWDEVIWKTHLEYLASKYPDINEGRYHVIPAMKSIKNGDDKTLPHLDFPWSFIICSYVRRKYIWFKSHQTNPKQLVYGWLFGIVMGFLIGTLH